MAANGGTEVTPVPPETGPERTSLEDREGPPPLLSDSVGDAEQPQPVAEPVHGTGERPFSFAPACFGTDVSDEDLSRLAAALEAHVCARRGDGSTQIDLLRASCLTLVVGPQEPGAPGVSSACCEKLRAVFEHLPPDALPEARLCHLWLSCAAGGEPWPTDKLVELARLELWEPFQVLVFRALAAAGEREVLASLLPKEGPLSLAQGDAWLEAAHATELEASWIGRVSAGGCDLLPSSLRDRWLALLVAESDLACSRDHAVAESTLTDIATSADETPPRSYAEAEARRIATRAVSALNRLALARFLGEASSGQLLPEQWMPPWERLYLNALMHWQAGDRPAASRALREALGMAPQQLPVRLALGTLLSTESPQEALAVIDHVGPSHESLVMKATLLVRLGRTSEAQQTTARLTERPLPSRGPARYSWARACEQSRRHERALRTALAEQRGDWRGAVASWSDAAAAGVRRTLLQARQFFTATLEMASLPVKHGWRHDVLRQSLDRHDRETSAQPFVGDALFFRAAALAERRPEQSLKELQTLLRQRRWVGRELDAGGGRLAAAGGLLLRLGQPEGAIRVYESLGGDALPRVKERLAVALVYAEVVKRAPAEALASAVVRAAELAPRSAWPQLLGAFGLLIAGDPDASRGRIEAATERGAPDALCRILCMFTAPGEAGAAVSDAEIATLGLPSERDALVRLVCGPGEESARAEAFVGAIGPGWPDRCPVEPSLLARRLLAAWCGQSRWDDAQQLAGALSVSHPAWGKELATLVRLRYALSRATGGGLEEADRLLSGLQAERSPG